MGWPLRSPKELWETGSLNPLEIFVLGKVEGEVKAGLYQTGWISTKGQWWVGPSPPVALASVCSQAPRGKNGRMIRALGVMDLVLV